MGDGETQMKEKEEETERNTKKNKQIHSATDILRKRNSERKRQNNRKKDREAHT